MPCGLLSKWWMTGFLFWLLKMQRNKKCIQPPDFQSSPCICSSSPLQRMIEDCEHRMWRTAAPAGIFEIIIQVVAVPWALKGIWLNNSAVGFVLLYFSVFVKKIMFSGKREHIFFCSQFVHLFGKCWFLPFISFWSTIPFGMFFSAILILSINS